MWFNIHAGIKVIVMNRDFVLLTWFNCNDHGRDTYLDQLKSMSWNYLFFPKLQRLHSWSLGMDMEFNLTLHTGCYNLSMLETNLIRVSKNIPVHHLYQQFFRHYWTFLWTRYQSLPPWWRHQMETVSALLAICAGNSPIPDEFRAQRPVTRGFDIFFDLRPDKRLSEQSWGWWLETPSHSLWRHRNAQSTSNTEIGCFAFL